MRHFLGDLELLEDRCLLSGAASAYGQIPLSFQPNVGQADARFDYLNQGANSSVLLSSQLVALALAAPNSSATAIVEMSLVGASAVVGTGLDAQPGVSNYIVGNDPAQWRTNVAHVGEVQYQGVYPGIDVVYHGNQQQLEYDFVVAPGAKPGAIQLAFTGQQALSLDSHGNLVVQTASGPLTEEAPVVYQMITGVRHTITGRYVLENGGRVGFAIGAYDPTQPLTIDPVLSYSTYLGGSAADGGFGIAVDASGEAYVVGRTLSVNFPTLGATQPSSNGNKEAFIAKLNATGTGLVFATYLGGTGNDEALNVAVDAAGNAYVTGDTQSTDFPILSAFQTNFGGGQQNAFIAKLSASGQLVYSSYLGGSTFDEGLAVAVDSAGDAFITGDTQSTDFPTANAFQPAYGGGVSPTAGDAFVTEVNPAGNGLVYSTFLGGSANDIGEDIVVDSAGDAFVAGGTTSSDFPTLNAVQSTNHGGLFDAFAVEIKPNGAGLVYGTYLGGSAEDVAYGIGIDAAGNTYIAGYTSSTELPTLNALQPSNANTDAFVAKLAPGGGTLLYSTYLGGSGIDYASGLAVDSAGNVFVTGTTASTNFPTVTPVQTTSGGLVDAFISEINPQGTALLYSTYLGGLGNDFGNRIVVGANDAAYVVGETGSIDFPVVNPLQGSQHGNDDAFIAKISTQTGPPLNSGAVLTTAGSGSATALFALTSADQLYRYQSATGWQLLGAGIRSISAVTERSGNVVVFAVTEISGLYRFDTHGWAQIGGTGSVRSVSGGTDSSGLAAAFVILTDGSFTEYRSSSGWTSTLGAAGTIVSATAAANDTAIAITADHSVYEYNRQFGWFPLTSSGFGQSLSAVNDSSGQLVVYAKALNEALYRYTPSNGWALVGGPGSIQAISAGTNASGQAVVYVRTTSNDFLENDPTRGWINLKSPSSVFEFAATNQDRVFVSLADGTIMEHDDTFGFYPLTSPGFAHA